MSINAPRVEYRTVWSHKYEIVIYDQLSNGPCAGETLRLVAIQAGDDGHARRSYSGKQTAG